MGQILVTLASLVLLALAFLNAAPGGPLGLPATLTLNLFALAIIYILAFHLRAYRPGR